MNTILLNCICGIAVCLASAFAIAEVMIGQSAALSGPAEGLGKEMKRGADAYFT